MLEESTPRDPQKSATLFLLLVVQRYKELELACPERYEKIFENSVSFHPHIHTPVTGVDFTFVI
jgi:hypothetical protein